MSLSVDCKHDLFGEKCLHCFCSEEFSVRVIGLTLNQTGILSVYAFSSKEKHKHKQFSVVLKVSIWSQMHAWSEAGIYKEKELKEHGLNKLE